MAFLETRVPPPLVALVTAAIMWVGRLATSSTDALAWRLVLAVVLALGGLLLATTGIRSFRRARTTVTPLKPQAASQLVVSGVYHFTRNPMYLGVCLVLLGWAAWLWSAWSLLGPVVFVAYITRFQIVPEERALAALFGAAYGAYVKGVRRWI